MIAVLRIGVKVRPGLLMLCSIVLTDLLWGGLVVPPYIAFWIKELIKGKVCPNFEELRNSLWIIPYTTCFLATTGILAVISFDRYIAVAKAMQYKAFMNNRRALIAVSFVWFMSLAWGTWRKAEGVSSSLYAKAISFYFVCSSGTIIVIQVLTLFRLHSNNTAVANMTAETNRVNPAANAANAATERQLTVTTGYVVGVFGLTFIPLACTNIAIRMANLPVAINYLLFPLIVLVGTIGSSVNVLIYFRRNSRIRNKIINLFRCQ